MHGVMHAGTLSSSPSPSNDFGFRIMLIFPSSEPRVFDSPRREIGEGAMRVSLSRRRRRHRRASPPFGRPARRPLLPHSFSSLFKMTRMNPLAGLLFQPTDRQTESQTDRAREERTFPPLTSSTGRRVNESGVAAAREKAES